jgi:hypothetical protein
MRWRAHLHPTKLWLQAATQHRLASASRQPAALPCVLAAPASNLGCLAHRSRSSRTLPARLHSPVRRDRVVSPAFPIGLENHGNVEFTVLCWRNAPSISTRVEQGLPPYKERPSSISLRTKAAACTTIHRCLVYRTACCWHRAVRWHCSSAKHSSCLSDMWFNLEVPGWHRMQMHNKCQTALE